MTIERNILVQALTGSHNYNLQTEGSDKDYKIFTAPTFDDMFKNYHYKQTIITETVDKDVKDIRTLPDLLWKANIAYLELLFSKELVYDKSNDSLRKLFDLKDEIVKMNLPYLFKSTGGQLKQRMAKLDKASEGTQHLVDAFGYNTKEAMHMFRNIDLIGRFAENDFKNFGEALRYEDESPSKHYTMFIKDGGFDRNIFVDFITDLEKYCFTPLKEKYCSQKPNLELKEHIENLVKDVVQDEIYYELHSKSH